MRDLLPDLPDTLAIGGGLVVVLGVAMIHVPSAIILLGLLLLAGGLLLGGSRMRF